MQIISFETIPSTNDYLKEHYKECLSPTIVTTEYQSKGRGRGNHQWISKKGEDLIFSLFVEDKRDGVTLTMIMAYSIVCALKTQQIDAKIKWPNDIYVNKKKVAGILTETIYEKDKHYLIIGVGLNINNKEYAGLPIKCSKEELLKTIYETYFSFCKKDYEHDLLDKINSCSYLKDVLVEDEEHGYIQYERLNADGTITITTATNEKYKVSINTISLRNKKIKYKSLSFDS
jgi:biotin-[acetyl-CoA-carboxylase] ligase BirA-like protein